MTKTNHRASKDFNRTLVASLNKRGVFFIGSALVPGADGSFANGERAYCLDDNGTHRVRSYAEVKALAA